MSSVSAYCSKSSSRDSGNQDGERKRDEESPTQGPGNQEGERRRDEESPTAGEMSQDHTPPLQASTPPAPLFHYSKQIVCPVHYRY